MGGKMAYFRHKNNIADNTGRICKVDRAVRIVLSFLATEDAHTEFLASRISTPLCR
jgi:hypothetical protein